MKVATVALGLVATADHAAAQGYGPDPAGLPADFMCEWRKLAFNYSSVLRPDSAAMVHDALQLTEYCNGTVPRPSEASLPAVFPPKTPPVDGAVVVDGTNGSDSNPGRCVIGGNKSSCLDRAPPPRQRATPRCGPPVML
jgi:hypothetical protein